MPREDYVISAPLVSPGPGRPFVDRENELRLVESKLEEGGVRGGQMRSCVICFWGAYGMGKSWLLKKLEEKYYSASINRSVSHPTIAVRLDLSRNSTKSLWHETRIQRELIIRELWKQLATQLGDDAPGHSLASSDEWAKDFVSTVTKWALASCTPLIMLDTVDDLIDTNDDDFGWLEEHLVEPLAITNRVLFIFTSRGEIKNWKCFQVRRRIDSRRLSSFDVNTAAKAVQADPVISRELFRHSFGHPLSTERLATLLEKNLNLDLQKASAFKKPLDPQVMRSILKQVDEEILRVFHESFRPIARAVSVLRWISVEPLRSIYEAMNPAETHRGEAFYLDEIIGMLGTRHLIYWNSEENCYQMDAVVRRLMNCGLEINQPALYSLAHQAAYNFHKDHLERYPTYLKRYVPELAFHFAALYKSSKDVELLNTFRESWKELLSIIPEYPEPRLELIAALKEDDELSDVMPRDVYQWLHNSLYPSKNPSGE